MNSEITNKYSCLSEWAAVLLTVIFYVCFFNTVTPAEGAFSAKKGLFSAEKPLPVGFSDLVEPNVLLLIDTSGSMAYQMGNSSSTFGDGSNPYNFGGGTTYYYFGKDNITGNDNTGNNVVSDDFNYHPLLRYIPEDKLPPTNRGNFSYDNVSTEWTGWRNSTEGSFLSSDYRLNPHLQIKKWFFLWQDVGRYDSLPTTPTEYRWDFQNGLWYLQKYATYTDVSTRYKYPNDSRMYTLKNVMYRILSDSTLVGNLRLGLASFKQTKYKNGSNSSNYNWAGNQQRITWKYPTSDWKMATLREEFKSTTKTPSHLDKIRQWFDGTEKPTNPDGTEVNPEFRADGNTPVATSIYFDNNESALAYFKEDGVITDWCQDNWLIVLTDGANNDGKNPVSAVTKLYGENIKIPDKPDGKNEAKKIKTFVIGLIDPGDQTTLKNTLNQMAAAGQTGNAYFPENMQELLDAFRDIFQKIQDFAATGSAPLVNPPRTSVVQGRAYSTGFKPKIDQQWTGYLYSYTVSGDVMITPENWEAGARLNAASASGRNIYTADWDGRVTEGVTGTNMKKFKADQVDSLRPLLAGSTSEEVLSNEKLADFIRWVRGTDVWDETEGTERWKLGDPYHVGLVEIGAPQSLLNDPAYRAFSSAELNKIRKKMLYLHSNDGMVHGFNSATGDEEWAFIPPNTLGFPRLLGTKLKPDNSLLSKESTPKYLLDGPLVGEDIFIDDSYKTVLLGSLGRAGCGLYAMDVTDPEKPQFLWALENNYYNELDMTVRPEDEQTFLTWTGNGPSATTSSELSAVSSRSSALPSKLRLAVSTPFIGTIRTLSGSKWVALLGAGAQYLPGQGTDDLDKGGKAIYILDMADGSMIKELSHTDLGMAVAPLSIEAGPSPLRIGKFYAGDHLGAVYEGDISSIPMDEWTLDKVFSPGEVALGDIVGIPYAIELGSIKNRKWLFWGTGDPDELFGSQAGQNYIVALNRSIVTPGSPATLPSLSPLDASDGDDVAGGSNGWYVALDADEVVSTPPVLYKGHLFLATYMPSEDPCEIGSSNVYIVNGETGKGGWIASDLSRKKRITLDSTRISGITVTAGKVFIGATRYTGASPLPTEMANATISGNMIVFSVPDEIENQDDDIPSKSARPTYWRDWKP